MPVLPGQSTISSKFYLWPFTLLWALLIPTVDANSAHLDVWYAGQGWRTHELSGIQPFRDIPETLLTKAGLTTDYKVYSLPPATRKQSLAPLVEVLSGKALPESGYYVAIAKSW